MTTTDRHHPKKTKFGVSATAGSIINITVVCILN